MVMYYEDREHWAVIDIQMAIKRYFLQLDRSDFAAADLEIDFMRSIHREWSYNPLMRRCDPPTMAIIDDFLKWFDSTPREDRKMNDFTIRRLLK
jgi:hypothetical protein